jgi:anti-anti-sigma factor
LAAALAGPLEDDVDRPIMIDAQALRFVDCAGLRALTDAAERAAVRQRALWVAHASGIVEEVLRVAGVDDLLGMPASPALFEARVRRGPPRFSAC